ncbi:MAG: hypothetical protein IT374_27505 [Polyangiaceae bacterium]|nr:hypothetical protein [Polyangiaceae bacterium]
MPGAGLFVACLLPVAYTGVAAARATGGAPSSIAATLLSIALVVAGFRLTTPRSLGEDLVGDGPRAALRCVIAAIGTAVTARAGVAGRAAFDAAASASVAAGSIAALYALARVPDGHGLFRAPPRARRLDAALGMVLVGAVATTIPAVVALAPHRAAAIDPLAIDYAAAALGLSALSVLALASLRFFRARRVELGAADRGLAAVIVSMTALGVAGPAAALDVAPPDRVLPGAALASSLGCALAMGVPDPRAVGRALSTVLVSSVVGVPIALFVATAARAAPSSAGGIVLLGGITLLVTGVLSQRIAARFRPDGARWRLALRAAEQQASVSEPHTAMRGALSALRDRLGPSAPSPLLFREGAGDVVSVDRAGYLQEARAVPPPDAAALARGEPFHTLRRETLRALEVQHPELRPTLAWMEAHDFAAVTSLDDEDGPLGLLAVPAARRRAPLTLDEATLLGRVADRVALALSLSQSLAGARARQIAAEQTVAEQAREAEALRRELSREAERYAALARRVARLAPDAAYSPASKLAEEALAKAAEGELPVTLLAPPGVLAEGWAAALHLASDRRGEPFVIVDGADLREHEAALWDDPVLSPLRLAAQGTLCVLDVPALPAELQARLARHAARLEPGPRVIVTVRDTVSVLAATGRLTTPLADALGDRAVPIPPLSARAEDLRALALDRLARLGLALRGAPLGLTDEALLRLVEHDLPGNDEQLGCALLLAVLAADGPRVTGRDLEAAGLGVTRDERAVFTRRAGRR